MMLCCGAVQVRHRRRKKGPQPIACVGMREWIFTENSGAQYLFVMYPSYVTEARDSCGVKCC